MYEYGFWSLVVINVIFYAIFAFSFLKPARKREWRSMGIFTAFLVVLFTEMYGFPLTIFFLTSILGVGLPGLRPFSHVNGHLLGTFLGLPLSVALLLCQIGSFLMLLGVTLMGFGWWQVYRARGELVTAGLYRWVRHPQYTSLFLITTGMMLQWPTLITVLMWPLLMLSYYRLAMREEQDMINAFGEEYLSYRASTPAFLPFLGARYSARTSQG